MILVIKLGVVTTNDDVHAWISSSLWRLVLTSVSIAKYLGNQHVGSIASVLH